MIFNVKFVSRVGEYIDIMAWIEVHATNTIDAKAKAQMMLKEAFQPGATPLTFNLLAVEKANDAAMN